MLSHGARDAESGAASVAVTRNRQIREQTLNPCRSRCSVPLRPDRCATAWPLDRTNRRAGCRPHSCLPCRYVRDFLEHPTAAAALNGRSAVQAFRMMGSKTFRRALAVALRGRFELVKTELVFRIQGNNDLARSFFGFSSTDLGWGVDARIGRTSLKRHKVKSR
jgi:hypothetical protein